MVKCWIAYSHFPLKTKHTFSSKWFIVNSVITTRMGSEILMCSQRQDQAIYTFTAVCILPYSCTVGLRTTQGSYNRECQWGCLPCRCGAPALGQCPGRPLWWCLFLLRRHSEFSDLDEGCVSHVNTEKRGNVFISCKYTNLFSRF